MKTSKGSSSAIYRSPDLKEFAISADTSMLSISTTGGNEQYNEYEFDWTTEA